MVYPVLKRIIDVLVSVVVLIVALPVLMVASILIYLYMGKPVLFRQSRPGYNEKPFTLIKFRTMLDAYDKNGNPLPDHSRLTRLGSVLRKTSLDELPQLWNVLKGEMSLVGPRPLFTKYLPFYTDRERKRHLVKPGITGLAQINGRNLLTWEDRLELDVQYVEKQSLLLDMNILFTTLVKVIKREGIAESAIADLSDYRGNAQT